MNNAGFAIMRYFRDLGADAWLLPFSTDGKGNLSHFAAPADTWNWEKWKPFVRPLTIPNTSEAVLGRPAALRLPPSRSTIRAELGGFSKYVGSGVAPALFEGSGLRLDIFWPYGMGIEFYGDHLYAAGVQRSPLRRLFHKRLRTLQAEGIRSAIHCLNAEMSLTRQSFDEIGKRFTPMGVPAVYSREIADSDNVPNHLRTILARIKDADLSLFTAARMLWVRDPVIPDSDWPSYTKNSDWLLRGLAGFLDAHPNAKPLLTLVEYGPDVETTKLLAAELDIADHIQWLPVMPRRELMLLLQASHIGVGEFYTDPGVVWGGTGWEVLASGRPLLQAFNFSAETYRSQFGHAPPPILDVKSAVDVTRRLTEVYAAPDKGRGMGADAALWFDEHGGIGLAKRWLDLLQTEAGAA